MILNDVEIREMVEITPFVDYHESEKKEKGITYGLTSMGYDLRVGRDYKVFTDVYNVIIDPLNFDNKSFVDFKDVDECIIPPHSFALAKAFEHVKMPRDVIALCIGKSTYARAGINTNITPIEPEWEGHITIEISNTTPLPCKIHSMMGICQLVFFRNLHNCERSYKDKKGRYQGQTDITLPFVNK